MRGHAARVVIAVVLLGGACVPPSSAPSSEKPAVTPLEPAGTWRELASEHFIVWTNTSQQRGRLLVHTLETLRQIVLGVSYFTAEVHGKSFVVAFHDRTETKRYLPAQFTAMAFSARNVLLQPVVVLPASALDDDRRIVTHELTHVVAFNAIPDMPVWISEGIAGYFETVRLDEQRAQLDVGAPLAGRVRQLQRLPGAKPVADVFACRDHTCMDDRFYATTWALVTYLINVHHDELVTYLQTLATTPPSDQDALWAKLFPALSPAVLDHELHAWIRRGSTRVLKYNIALREWPVQERPISEADVLAAKGLLRYLVARPDPSVPEEIAQALQLDPTHLLANGVRAYATKAIAAETVAALTSAHPGDWRAWMIAWLGATTGAQRVEAREHACALIAADSTVTVSDACVTAAFNDARRAVIKDAMPLLAKCMLRRKLPLDISVEIAEDGSVSSAQASFGSPDASACAERVLKGLTFPAHHPGPYKISSSPN